jgi:hypothetical protein
MGADRRDYEDAFAVSHHPDPVLALEFGIHAETEIGGVADLEPCIRLVKNPREEEAEKHQEVHAQCSQNCCRDESAPMHNGHTQIGVFLFREDGANPPDQARFRGMVRGSLISGWRAADGHLESEDDPAVFPFHALTSYGHRHRQSYGLPRLRSCGRRR